MQDGNTVWIDQKAAGHGWFLDAGPGSDRAFFRPTPKGELHAPAGSPAFGKMDLLTVVVHEMGHVLGLAENGDPQGVMDETLEAGIRRLPALSSAGPDEFEDSGSVDAAWSRTTILTAGLGQATVPGANDTSATPAISAVIDHLLQSGELSVSRSQADPYRRDDGQRALELPIISLDSGLSAPAGSSRVWFRPSPPARGRWSVPAGRSLSFAITGTNRRRLIPDSIDPFVDQGRHGYRAGKSSGGAVARESVMAR
jgi:hypothetical protein